MSIAVLIVGAALAAVLAWNFIPAVRERMRGWSTLLEGAIGVALTAAGVFADVLQEAQRAGYLPPWAIKYVPAVLFGWMIWKRIVTNTGVGKK